MPLLHASLVRSILTEAAVNVAPRGAVEGNMNRRTAVGVLGGLAFGTVAAAWGRRAFAQPVCTLTPEQIEGPFYLDQARMREAISEDKPGVPLQLILRVVEASASCAPISKAAVDVWQCDALGIYSGYEGAAIAPRHVEPVERQDVSARHTAHRPYRRRPVPNDLPGLVPGPHAARAPEGSRWRESGHHPALFPR